MNSFLRNTAESILEHTEWKQLSRTTLVLPSHRAGLVLKEELLRLQQERHAQAVWAPTVQTLTQLQDALSPLYPEDELFTIVRLYKIYRNTDRFTDGIQNTDLMPLDLFLGWGRQMLADFTNIDASMPAEEVPDFFANTVAAHELSEWQLDQETEERLRRLINPLANHPASTSNDSVKSQYALLWRQLYEMYKALRKEMEKEQKGYAGMRQRAVIEHWEDESIQTQIAGRTYIFVGFNYLLPVERELMEKLRDSNRAQFYWDYVPDFATNTKAFYFAQLNHSILGGTNIQPSTLNSQPSTLHLISCSSREAQAQFVHRWLQENYTAKGQKVGVVICDETMLEPVIYTLPAITLPGEDEPAPINITKGFPLRNTAVYAQVLSWLADPSRGKADDLIEPEWIDRMIEATLNAPHSTLNTQHSTLNSQLSTLTWQELLILESEYQVRKLANQLRGIISEGIGVPFTLRLLRLLFRRMMESVTMPFHGEPVTDVQVMGVLETRLLDFDRLLLLNVEEGVLPQRQNDCSFIPYYLRKAYHMQTPDERATVYAYNFFRLIHRTKQATLLYAEAGAADSGKGMSRFVMQLLYSPAFAITRSVLQEKSVLQPTSDNLTMTTSSLLDTLTKDERGALRKADGHRFRFSPSALNTFIACPRSFYLQYILGLRPKDQEEVLFEASTMGSFVHHAMEFIYRTCFHCDNTHPVPVTPEAVEAVLNDESVLQAALMAAYDAMNKEREERQLSSSPYLPENHVGENVVIKGYMRNILERDREDAKTGLQMLLLEQERSFPVVLDGIGEVLTGGIIDRLDIYGPQGNEHLRVVDYKSGSYSDTTHAKRMTATWEEMMESEEKGYVRQTLIYCHAVLQHGTAGLPVEPNLYFCRRKLTDIVTTIDVQNETVHDYASIRKPFYDALCAKMAQVLTTTDFPQCEPDKCPAFCPFFELCGRKQPEY